MSSSGIQTGGSDNRPHVVFKGFSNTRGGTNLKGSARQNLKPGFFEGGKTGFRFLNKFGSVSNVKDPGKLSSLRSGEMNTIQNPFRAGLLEFKPQPQQAAQPFQAAPAAPAAAPAITGIPQFDALLARQPAAQNQFLTQLANLRLQREQLTAPLEARRDVLRSPIPGFQQTPFQIESQNLQNQQAEQSRRERFESAASGVLNSGFRDLGLRDVRQQQEQELVDLSERVGPRALSNIAQQLAGAQLQFAQSQVPLFLQTASTAQQGGVQELSDLLSKLLAERGQQTEAFNTAFGVNF